MDGLATFLVIAAIVVTILLWYWPIAHARKIRHPRQDAIFLLVVASLFTCGLTWIVAAVWAVSPPLQSPPAPRLDREDAEFIRWRAEQERAGRG